MYEVREPEEDTGAIQTFKVRDEDSDLEIENPDVVNEKEFAGDLNGAEVVALENMWMNVANEYAKGQKEQKNYPRIDVMIDKNCLISYTGHMEDFDFDGFYDILDRAIMARIDLDRLWNDRVIKGPREIPGMTGYQ